MPWSSWARAPQLLSLCSRAMECQPPSPRALKPCSATKATTRRSLRTSTRRVAPARRNWRKRTCINRDPAQSKINKSFIKKKISIPGQWDFGSQALAVKLELDRLLYSVPTSLTFQFRETRRGCSTLPAGQERLPWAASERKAPNPNTKPSSCWERLCAKACAGGYDFTAFSN